MNPFVYDKPAEDKFICQRIKETEKIVSLVANHTNILLTGKRRFGKTTLVRYITRNKLSSNVISVYIDVFSITSEADFVRYTASAIAKTIIEHDTIKKTTNALAGIISILGNRIKFSLDIGLASITTEIKPSESKEALEDVLNGFAKWLENKKLCGFVVFDEFQQIASVQKKFSIEARLRTITQNHNAISYLFMGSKDHIIANMFSSSNRPFYTQATPIQIGPIEIENYSKWAVEWLNTRKITINQEAITYLFALTDGETRLNNMVLHRIFETQKNTDISKETIGVIVDEMVAENDYFVRMWFDQFPLVQKKALKIIAANRGKLYAADIMAKYDTEKGSISKAIEALINKDEVAKEGNSLIIKDRINEIWVSKIANL